VKFVCTCCRQEFTSTWTEQEALDEHKKTFGVDAAPDRDSLVCSECYDKILGLGESS